MEYKNEKTAALIKNLAADFLQRESSGTSLITVTRVRLSNKGKTVDIFFTVYPESKEHSATEFAGRKAAEFQEYVKSHAKMRVVPFFRFGIDKGEKNRQRLDMLRNKNQISIFT